jgi:cytochrome c-type biogenesis protein CcmE
MSTGTASRTAGPKSAPRKPRHVPQRSEPTLRSARRGYDSRVGASPARLVIALSVAAALAIFVLYTALAGASVAQLTPSTIGTAKGNVLLVGKVVGPVQRIGASRRFAVKDIGDRTRARVYVNYNGSVPDLFRTGRDISVAGVMRHGRFVATPGSLITKCPDHYAPQPASSKT